MTKTMSEALSATKPTADKSNNELVEKVGWAVYFAGRKAHLFDDEIEEISQNITDVTKAAIQAYEAHLSEQGLVVVPREPTPDCIATNGSGYCAPCCEAHWKAMITASQGE